ncbi:MAG: hypothetical protein WCG27_05800 [Pseudomonadota bacterium]
MEANENLRAKLVFEGSYDYFKKGHIYAEEKFQVYKDQKVYDHIFISELLSRTNTGEMLKINTDYEISKDWIPQTIKIKKRLGEKEASESFYYDRKNNIVQYKFVSNEKKTESRITTAPRFHVSTPTAASSMLFILAKRFDATARNDYGVISSFNQWKYVEPPRTQNISLERVSVGNEVMIVNDQELSCVKYRILETVKFSDQNMRKDQKVPHPPLMVYLSNHLAIPYIREGEDGSRVQIKFLKDIESES